MSKNKIIFLILASIFTQIGLFQNCNKVQISDVSQDESLLAYAVPENTPVVQAACNNSPHQKMNFSYHFPKPSKTCEWSVDGNLAPRDQYFQGRIEEEQKLTLSPNTIICDIKFNFNQQQFLYDDHFLVTFNNAVIASSYNFDSVLTRRYSLLRYDWSKMAGMFWDHKKEGTYCAGDGVCSWPTTDTEGMINISYNALMFQKIMAEDLSRYEHSFKFVSIGDNDEFDCEHSDVDFNIDVEYVNYTPSP